MKKLLLIFTGLLLLTGSGLLNLCAQELKPEGIVFRNAPVLFRKDKKLYQQILAVVKSEKPGKISFSVSGKEILGAEIKTGENKYLLTIPAVHSQTNIKILAKTDNSNAVYYPFTVKPPEKWEIYLVQHSHTDIGYTRPQSEILAEQMRYIDYALDYSDNTDRLPDYARFRWTCESS